MTTVALKEFAHGLAEAMGRPYNLRYNYAFTYPSNGSISTKTLPAVLFSGVMPSFNSAAVAFAPSRDPLDELGYLGAPIVVRENKNLIEAFVYTAPLVAERFGEAPKERASRWLRSDVIPRIEHSRQLKLQLGGADLLLGETTDSLRRAVAEMMHEIGDTHDLTDFEAFKVAIDVVRNIIFGEAPGELAQVADKFRQRLTFSNIPLEAIGALYESLATTVQHRRATGLYYTPDWLARRLIDRLRPQALRSGLAVDPAVGSGTFLLCFLDRLIDDRANTDPSYTPSLSELSGAVAGIDVDTVALEASRLTLDLLANRLGLSTGEWRLLQEDSTDFVLNGTSTLIGNLPFGYRTHRGGGDLAAAIAELWLQQASNITDLALILPHSFTYDRASSHAREVLASTLRIDEIIMLPEEAFQGSSVRRTAVVASKGPPGEAVLVRRVDQRSLPEFRRSGVTRTHSARLPNQLGDRWLLTPFYSEFAQAEKRAAAVVGDYFTMHVGLQTYGVEQPAVTEAAVDDDAVDGPRLLDDAKLFLLWRDDIVATLPRLTIPPSALRRTGPIEKYADPKLIVRRVTNQQQRARLAAIDDGNGVWFTDRFIGIWPRPGCPLPLGGLAAYLQTAIVEAWYLSANPSRTLRLGALQRLPIPKLPSAWWRRAMQLVPSHGPAVAPRWMEPHDGSVRLFDGRVDTDEWEWFEEAVLSAFGIPGRIARLESYLTEHLTVGGGFG